MSRLNILRSHNRNLLNKVYFLKLVAAAVAAPVVVGDGDGAGVAGGGNGDDKHKE